MQNILQRRPGMDKLLISIHIYFFIISDFPGKCYSWTAQKWYSPNDTWSLKPFCGTARCVALRNTKTNKTFLGEEVTDCGLIIDLGTVYYLLALNFLSQGIGF